MKTATLFRLTATVILIQIALGGLVTFSFINPLLHIAWGILVAVVAFVTAVAALRSNPVDRQLRGVGIGIVVATLFQGILGFSTLALNSDALAWGHLVLGVLIYAMALTGMSFAQRGEHLSVGQAGVQPGAKPAQVASIRIVPS
jgi:heme A synthase